MKRILLFIAALACSFIYAQAPQGFSYQAIAFDNNGNPVQNTTIAVKVSILDQSVTGTVLFSESHTPTTNDQGLFNLSIGIGSNLSGTFEEIDWGNNSKFVKLELDITGGTNYITVGTSQLMSVPYALYAENSNSKFWQEAVTDTISLKEENKVLKVNDVEISQGNLQLSEPGSGITLTSPNGTLYKLTVSDSGIFTILDNETNEPINQDGSEVELSGSITTDLTLDPTKTYTLTGPTFVENGATLTIPAGMTIYAASTGADVYLAVTQGGIIKAEGTASEPIVFTSAAATPNAGDWGGIILLGKAPINSVNGTTVTSATSEIASLPYGGTISNDYSGILKYVRVEYSGGRADGISENDAFTFYGVGNTTVIQYIQAFECSDDGIEFRGGTVNASNVALVNCQDDSLDWTEGYTGTLTDVYIKHGAQHDKGIEADGYNIDVANNAGFFSKPTLTNVSILGLGSGTANEAVRLRAGTQGIFSNIYIEGFAEGFDLDGDNGDNPTGAGVLSGDLNVDSVLFSDVILNMKNDTGDIFTESVFLTESNAVTGTNFISWGTGWTRQ